MDNKDQIKDLFADKLGQMEMPVRPELWTSISSQIGSGAVAGSSAAGLSLVSKIIIGISVVAASTVAGVYLLNDKDQKQAVETKKELQLSSENMAKNEVSNELQSPALSPTTNQQTNQTLSEELQLIPIIEFEPPQIEDDGVQQHTLNIQIPGGQQQVKSGKEDKSQPNEPISGSVAVDSSTDEFVQDDPHVDEEAINNTVSTVEIRTNTFTPNGDGVNDEFLIESSGELFDFNLVILDRMNKVVFQSSDPNFKWDGRNQGGDFVAAGTYLYYLTAVDVNGKKVAKANSLTINR